MSIVLSADERAEILQLAWRQQVCEKHRRLRPADYYNPHHGGQLQFHKAPHTVRCLFPGNGFGKTTAAGVEVNWWVTHSHPWQQIPRRPLIVIWCCETFKQFKILRTQLEEQCFDRPFRFNKGDNLYSFEGGPFPGSQMFLVSGDASWTHVQGINPDLVIFDEEPPEALWNEMKMRRRGLRKTRYCFAATATRGMTWMYRDLYVPWLKHHADQGLDELAAMCAQTHPTLWVWPRGGIDSNPGADRGDRAWYHSQTFNSDAERSVRLGGGFADFSGTPVFDLFALEQQLKNLQDGQVGAFVHVPAKNADDKRAITITDRSTGKTARMLLVFAACGVTDKGRVTIFKRPIPGHKYVIGHDSAYGLRDGDFDAAVVLDRMTGEQVAEAYGRWGPSWAEQLLGLAWHYNQAFLCGERQVGLFAMRRLFDDFGYTYQYMRRDEQKRDRDQSQDLGHHRLKGDLTIPRLRRAIAPRDIHGRLAEPQIIIRSRELHRQLVKFQFRPRLKTMELHEAHDEDLEYGAPTGDHDDLVFAAGYAQMALHEVDKVNAPEVEYPEGSAGEVFGIRQKFYPAPKQSDPFAQDDK
ncbi:hypothetical protein [Fontivita pretiosa]|uniref:hypothetical protein n=1 Tax=Fontivita pretiosa TaxID=2989684 RepID=UPI003D1702FE